MRTVNLQLDILYEEGIKDGDAEIVKELVEYDLKHNWGLGHYDLGGNEAVAYGVRVMEKSGV